MLCPLNHDLGVCAYSLKKKKKKRTQLGVDFHRPVVRIVSGRLQLSCGLLTHRGLSGASKVTSDLCRRTEVE